MNRLGKARRGCLFVSPSLVGALPTLTETHLLPSCRSQAQAGPWVPAHLFQRGDVLHMSPLPLGQSWVKGENLGGRPGCWRTEESSVGQSRVWRLGSDGQGQGALTVGQWFDVRISLLV